MAAAAAANSENSVRKIYQTVIDEVITNVRDQFLDEGLDEQLLLELKSIWETKLNATRVFQNAEENNSTNTLSTSSTSARLPISHQATKHSSVTAALNALPQQHQSQTQQHVVDPPKSTIKQLINQQIDGHDDIDSSDDDDEDIIPTGHSDDDDVGGDDDDDDEDDNFNKQNDEGNDEGKEDPDPLNSSDDVSEHDPNEIFDVDNVIICQYDKLTRIKTRWKFHLKDGVMNINGKDYLFSKATGEADW